MDMRFAMRQWTAAAFAAGLWGLAPAADAQPNVFKDGNASFVVSDIAYVLAKDSSETGACPLGRSLGYRAVYQAGPEGKRREGESDKDYSTRIDQGSRQISNPNGNSVCLAPESAAPDPFFRTVTGKDVAVDGGIDLDGQDSEADERPAPGTCAHDDFRGPDGRRNIDNQFFRAVGCINSFQPTGQSNSYAIEMLTGAWGILITLSGAEDLHNAANVEVGFYANNDPIQLSPGRTPLPYATYAVEQDPRFRSTTHGRIVNGVLTTDPMNVRTHVITNSIREERVLEDARLRLTFKEDGSFEGYMAGYTPIEAMYNYQFGFRDGKDGKGEPASLRLRTITSTGAADTLGYTCEGIYAALNSVADGHRDPQTGKCSAISTQYRIKGIPAFVVDKPTQSVNSELDKHPTDYRN